MATFNKILLSSILCIFFIETKAQTVNIIKDTLYNRQIQEQHIYNCFVVQYDSLMDIYSGFNDTIPYITDILFKDCKKNLLELSYSPMCSNEKNSLTITYYQGQNIIEEKYNLIEYVQQDSLRRKEGVYRAYFPTKEIKERGFYKNDVKTGKWIYYYQNGEIRAKGKYSGDFYWIKNVRFSTKLFVTKPNLDTLFFEEYPADLKEFLDTIPSKNVSVFPYIYNKKTGEWFYYNKAGELIKKEYYNEKGLYKREFYENGKIHKETEYQ